MTDHFGAFRLNFEQQQKRARELLKAARAGEPAAVARFKLALGRSGARRHGPVIVRTSLPMERV